MENVTQHVSSEQTDKTNQVPQPLSRLPKKTFVIVVIAGLFILGIVGGIYYFGTLIDKHQSKNVINLPQAVTPSASPALTLSPVYIGNYEVDVKVSSDSPCNTDIYLHSCKSDIYLIDKTTGKETYILTTNDVIRGDSRTPQYRNGYIFLIKRTGNDKYPSNDWTDELWVYVDKNHGQKIYDSKGLKYNANQDGSLVALLLYEDNSPATNSVTILSKNNDWEPKKYSLDAKQCNSSSDMPSTAFDLDLEKWQQNTSVLWGVYASIYRIIGCYWKLNPETSAIGYYPVPNSQILFALNTDKLVALYVDKPIFGDSVEREEWLSTNSTYALYLYSLETKKSTVIATFPSNFSNIAPNWDSSTQLRYSSPEGRVTYTLGGQ